MNNIKDNTQHTESQESGISQVNRYVKVKGHPNWFLVLEANENEPAGLSETMHERILRTELATLNSPEVKVDYVHRINMAANKSIDYEHLAKKYGTILIRPIGSYMSLSGNQITDETFDSNFPIQDFAEIVICENAEKAEYKWVEYLKNRFPNKKILTINFFDLRSESEIEKYFQKAKYITFSTTFTHYDWFEKLTKFCTPKNIIMGYCHDKSKWEIANEINPNVEIVNNI